MERTFWKYHGTGNHFVVLEGDDLPGPVVQSICDPHRGVGADGVLMVRPISDRQVRMVIFNRDGTRPQMCGNGVRCVARWAVEKLGMACELEVLSDAGPRVCSVQDSEGRWTVRVDMGAAVMRGQSTVETPAGVLEGWHVSMGNPHFVVFGKALTLDAIDRAGAHLNSAHPEFLSGVNLEISQVRKDGIEVVVYERGVGRTQACGTGACAVAAAAWKAGHADQASAVAVKLPGGSLTITSEMGHVWMAGDCEQIFEGTFAADWLASRRPLAPD